MIPRFCAACGTAMPGPSSSLAGARLACTACLRVHYLNPEVVAACIARDAAGTSALFATLVEPAETLQAAARRALGVGVLPGDDELALYCTLSDEDEGRVWVVFRAPEDWRVAAPGSAGAPAWQAELLALYAADSGRRSYPVRDAVRTSGSLRIEEVRP